jgi:AcrR family transcriptional regulator
LPNTKKRSAAHSSPATDAALAARIIGAAFGAFMARGYANTSMLEIATRAKISKRDLYASFPSKSAVLVACIASRASRMRLSGDLAAPTSREMLASTLEAFGATVIREVCEPAATSMYRLAIAESGRSPEVASVLNDIRHGNRKALEQLLALAQAASILGPGDPRKMMEHFLALLWGDLLLSRLLGARAPAGAEITRRAAEATAAFLKLYCDRTPATKQSAGRSPLGKP